MKLIVEEDPDAAAPEDISHVYSGYAPLSVRLVQHFTKSGAFRSVEEVWPHYQHHSSLIPLIYLSFCAVLRIRPSDCFRDLILNTSRIYQLDTNPKVFKKMKFLDCSKWLTLSRFTLSLGEDGGQPGTTLVFFLGGCTYAEVSAIRFLNRQEGGDSFLCRSDICSTRGGVLLYLY